MMQSVQLRALAVLLDYPRESLREHATDIGEALVGLASGNTASPHESLRQLVIHLTEGDLLDLQAEYVETFDHGRSTCLNLFEHLLGDCHERGQAMVDLLARYERAGLTLSARQLPDYLPVYLEYASVLEPEARREALRPIAAALVRMAAALERRGSPWLAAMVAVARLAGANDWKSAARTVPASRSASPDDAAPAALDAAWAEQPVDFLGAARPRCGVIGALHPALLERRSRAAGGEHGPQ